MMELYNVTTPTAKKEHWCEMCHKPIKVGEKYSNEAGKYDGDFFERKMHLDCFDMFNMMLDNMGEHEFQWDDFNEWWTENKCPICKFRYRLCKPDKRCSYPPDECDFKVGGNCTTDDLCNDLTRVGWCDKFQKA